MIIKFKKKSYLGGFILLVSWCAKYEIIQTSTPTEILVSHSSEIRGLCLMKLSSETVTYYIFGI